MSLNYFGRYQILRPDQSKESLPALCFPLSDQCPVAEAKILELPDSLYIYAEA